MAKKVKILLYLFLVLLSIMFIGAIGFFIVLEPAVPLSAFSELDNGKLTYINKTLTILDANGNPISEKIYDNNKIYTRLNTLPEYVTDCFVAIEDKRFYSHNGVDYFRIIGAAKNNLQNMSFKEGASTISQQLIKNTHLSSEKTIARKINEIRIAKQLEKQYSKGEILEMYLNILYFGNNIYGIGSASEVYFNKPAQFLTLAESAMLAGMINNPSRYSLITNQENAEKRKELVLARMLEQKLISDEQYRSALSEKIDITKNNFFVNQYICDTISSAQKILGISKKQIFDGNYTICSNFDGELYEKTKQIVAEFSKFYDCDMCIEICDNKNSSVISKASSAKNDISGLRRQPGSLIKPFICYAPALEKKLIYPITPIKDEYVNFNGYEPNNHDEKFHGWVSCEQAIAKSYNIPAVKLLNMNGIEYSKEIAKKTGWKFSKKDNFLGLALGGLTEGSTFEEILTSYLTLSNNGYISDLDYVSAIYDKNNRCIYRAQKEKHEAIGEDTSELIRSALYECVQEGTAKRLKNNFYDNICAKTGTVGNNDGNSDAYIVAFTPKFTVLVWMGRLDGKLMSNTISGSTIPATVCSEVLKILNDSSEITMSDIVVKIPINSEKLTKNQKILLATDEIVSKDRIYGLFSKNNIPYSLYEQFDKNYSKLDNFDNFKIVDGFSK